MSFDSIARPYRWLETLTFGHALQRARVCWIENIPRPKRTLILGEGNGRFLCQLLRTHPKTSIDCVDASSKMLKLAQRRARRVCPASCQQVRFIHEDFRTWESENSYDLLVTHFFLDCFHRDELEPIVDKIADIATPNASWLLADFILPDSGILTRLHARLWLRAMHSFFQAAAGISATELEDPSPFIHANGFARASRKISRARMITSELWQRRVAGPVRLLAE